MYSCEVVHTLHFIHISYFSANPLYAQFCSYNKTNYMHWFLKFTFGIKLYMFLSIIRSFFTVHTAMLYVIQVCWQLASRIRTKPVLILLASCQKTCMKYTIAVCTVKISWWWTEGLSEACRFLFQIKFEKLVRLFGFIIRIYQDASSPQRQNSHNSVFVTLID